MARKSRRKEVHELYKEEIVFRTGLYSRLSSESYELEEDNSIGNQKKMAYDFAAAMPEIQIVKEYADNGWTGTNFNRPAFQSMMADIAAGAINCVIVKDFSRLGRNDLEVYGIVEMFKSRNIRFISILDGFDTWKNGDLNDIGIAFTNIINAYYPKDCSVKIRSAINRRIEQGDFLPASGSVPYGYKRDSLAGSYLVDEEVKDVIGMIFQMRATGMAYHAIAEYLEKNGVPSPGKLRYQRGMTKAERYQNARWTHKTIKKIVEDRVYLGDRIHGRVRRDRLGTTKKKREPEEWKIVENAHPAIISEILFDQALKVGQEERLRRSGFAQRENPEHDYREALRGKVVCGDCGCPMRAYKWLPRKNSPNGKAKIIYQCRTYRDSGQRECANHYVTESLIVDEILRTLQVQASCLCEKGKIRTVQERGRETGDALLFFQNEINRQQHKMENLLQDYMDGVLEKAEYVQLRQKYAGQLEEMKKKKIVLKDREEKERKDRERIQRAREEWKRFDIFQEVDRQLMDMFIKEVKVFTDKRLEILLKFTSGMEDGRHA